MFGSHLSIAGSMLNALDDAKRLGFDTVQVFTKNQQQWKAKPLDPGLVKDWHARAAELGFDRGGPKDARGQHRGGITSHASYLINLAAPADALWRQSIDLMTDEIERCEQLGIPFLVHHPGAFTTSSLDEGLRRIADAYAELFSRTKGYATVSCLEGTVGAGSQIGGPFEELARLRSLIIEKTGQPERVGFCLDTCHVHAAGYDLSSAASAKAALSRFDELCGLSHVRVWHINDSKGAAGSHLDRHDHIGHGTIGGPAASLTRDRLLDSGFGTVVNHPAFAHVPKHLETPKEDAPNGRAWDSINVARLRSLRPGEESLWPVPPELKDAPPTPIRSGKTGGKPGKPSGTGVRRKEGSGTSRTPTKVQQSKPKAGSGRRKPRRGD